MTMGSKDEAVPVMLTRAQLDLIKEDLDAGAEPLALARWIGRITDRTPEQIVAIAGAAEDLRQGRGKRWYDAADALQE